MNQILHKRIADMTTIEMMESAYLIEVSKKITMTLQEFCQVTGWDKRKVYQRIKNKILPDITRKTRCAFFQNEMCENFVTNEKTKKLSLGELLCFSL